MPVTTRNKRSKKASAIVDSNVANYKKHPFFVKKANEAKTILKKVGLPKKQKQNNYLRS